MSENSLVTQCPFCLTQFRVDDEQLNVAHGQVRCGSCLHVFDANKNRLRVDQSKKDNASSLNERHRSETHSPSQPPVQNNLDNTREISRKESLQHLSSLNDIKVPTLKISTEPVTLQAPEIVPPLFSFGWFTASVLAILCILLQIVWFNRVELYWSQPQLQPLFDQACQKIDCQIPPQQALSQIENQNILVTPHPSYEGAMEIKLILINNAEFIQPYPALNLEFKDLKGRLVAQRIFEPREYLDTTYIDPLAMPSQQPMQITLELMSPGKRAVNYQLELLAPKQ
ncbi:MAG: DUF3426 domain-containing protein [Neptuniibacter sp.]